MHASRNIQTFRLVHTKERYLLSFFIFHCICKNEKETRKEKKEKPNYKLATYVARLEVGTNEQKNKKGEKRNDIKVRKKVQERKNKTKKGISNT